MLTSKGASGVTGAGFVTLASGRGSSIARRWMPPLPTSTPKRRLWRRNWRRTKLRSAPPCAHKIRGLAARIVARGRHSCVEHPFENALSDSRVQCLPLVLALPFICCRTTDIPPPIRTAKPLEFRHQERQGAFGGRRAKHDQKLVLDVTQEADDRKAERPRNRTQYDQNEDRRGRIEGENKVEKVPERARPIARGSISTITSRSMTFAIPRTPNHQRARR